jgi:FkbM family methyltransferase
MMSAPIRLSHPILCPTLNSFTQIATLMKFFAEKIRSLFAYPRVFESFADIKRFRRLLKREHLEKAPEVPFTIKLANSHPLFCRPGTTDAVVLWDTFRDQFHLPPDEIKHPEVILDLGANVGFTAVDFAVRYPKAKVIAVEMDAENARLALRNTAPWQDRCILVNAAVWVADGEIRYGGEEEWGFHILASEPHNEGGAGQKTASARSISSLLREFNIQQVDYLKMDIEGAEDEVLKNSGPWIDKVRSMKVEIHARDSYAFCEQILCRAGFHCFRDKRHDNCIVAVRK